MRTVHFVTKETLRRARQSMGGVLCILLGIGIFVASQTLNSAMHDRSKEQLLRLGANIIVQPKGQPFDINSGVAEGEILLPESYVAKIRTIEHNPMLIAVSPKLYERFEISGSSLLVVGITADETKAKPWWMIDNRVVTDEFPNDKEILLGHYAGARLAGDAPRIELENETFKVSGILDETGSPDDFMAFVGLPVLQRLVQKQGMANLIEVSTSCIACAAMNVYDVAKEIDNVLPPDAQVLAVRQIAEAQMGTLKKIMGFTTIGYLVVLSLCAFLLMNYMSGAVDERRREIGMLLAMGMDPRKIQLIFLGKALVFAAVGGLLGYVTGTAISVFLGPLIAEAKVLPVPSLLPISFAVALGLGAVSSVVPAKRISKLDPIEALREV